MKDIVERLRNWQGKLPVMATNLKALTQEAADEIERLRAFADKGTVQALEDANDRAEEAEAENADLKKVMETMRPVWADATIVGCLDTALADLWTELEAKHETEAMQKLRDLKALRKEKANERHALEDRER